MIYFITKKKWAVKNNFEETIEYLANFGVGNIFQHVDNVPKNFTYISTFSAELILESSLRLFKQCSFQAAVDLTILADKSTGKADCSQMSIFVCFVDAFGNKLFKRLGIVKFTTSKMVVDLHEFIMKHLESKNLDSLCIRFSVLDGKMLCM